MSAIKSAPRSSLTAFAPDAPYLAAGTMAGTVDPSFSSSAHLEIFHLDFQSPSSDLPLAAACPSNDRFNRLSWSKPRSDADESFSLGLIAGGHADGTIGVWNPHKLISGDLEGAVVASLEKHTGPVRGLEFNALTPNLLVSGADEGELCIWDLEKPSEPNMFPPLKSVGSGAQTEVSFVSWNPKFQPILASTSYNGIVVVWDLRQQKPLTSFSDSHRRRCSVLQWNPDLSTQLIIASDDDNSPSLRVWDVRKTINPTRELVGHTKGVIAMSWCSHDSSLLLTCAKDNRTICWDPTSGEMVSELPPGSNSNFDVHWYPKIPGVISASSFDVKIGIYNIEACSRLLSDEFDAPARKNAPKWLKCPTGASFGFGGKLVSFQPGPPGPSGAPTGSEVYVHDLVTEHDLVSRSTEFEASIENGEKTSLRVLCEKKSEVSLSEYDRETWAFLKVMFEEEGTTRTKLLAHLGFDAPSDEKDCVSDELGNKLTNSLNFEETTSRDALLDRDASAFLIDNGEDFFNNPHPSEDNFVAEDDIVIKGNQLEKEVEDHLETSDPTVDDCIQRALVVGDYKGAVVQCISANRMADALVIAHAGSPLLWESTRDQYLKNSLSPYLKVVSALVSNDLATLVNTRPLNFWKETLALLCTFAQKEEWTILCDTLASRLMTVGNTLAATLCYICAGNIDKTVEIWSHSLKSDNEGRSYVDLLQDLMEKTIVLALATGQKRFSASLSKLVENYAELLASQGLLTTALEYLKLLGSEELSHELAILRDRIELSANTERGASKSWPNQNGLPQSDAVYNSPYYNQQVTPSQSQQQPQNIPANSYTENYQHPAVSYEVYPQKPQFEYNQVPFQPQQQPAMFVPSHSTQIPQPSFTPPPVSEQPTVRPFIPATPTTLRNVEQYQQPSFVPSTPPALRNVEQYQQPYQQPSLGHQLYSSVPGEPGVPSQVRTSPGHMFPQPGPTPGPRSFMSVTNPSVSQRPGMGPVQPSSPTQPIQMQQPAAPPAVPPPTVQTVNTSNVPAELRPVISTLTRLYHETSEAFGGSRANPSKKREIEDNSRKIGALFARLNNGDISPNAATKLCELCQALDSGDFAAAMHTQVLLTTSDWDECNFWLATLKRMIRTRQTVRIN